MPILKPDFKVLAPQEVYQGRWVKLLLNGVELAECYGNKATTQINKSSVPRCGTMMNGSVPTSADNTGSLKLHKINANIQKQLLEGLKDGQFPTFSIVETEYNMSTGGYITKTYSGVSFDSLDWANWDAEQLSDYELAYTFDDAKFK